jgi:hypothetical protein
MWAPDRLGHSAQVTPITDHIPPCGDNEIVPRCRKFVVFVWLVLLAGCSHSNRTSMQFRHTGMTACVRVDTALRSGVPGDWQIAASALTAARKMARTERDRQVLRLVEGYYQLGQIQQRYPRNNDNYAAVGGQISDCRQRWLDPYLIFLAPVQPPPADNACVRPPLSSPVS